MTTLQSLLTTWGQPPDRICLDWAWQLCELGDSQGLGNEFGFPSFSGPPSTLANTATELTWHDVTVDPQGRLEVRYLADDTGPAPRPGWTARALLVELLQWANIPSDNLQAPEQLRAELIDSTIRAASVSCSAVIKPGSDQPQLREEVPGKEAKIEEPSQLPTRPILAKQGTEATLSFRKPTAATGCTADPATGQDAELDHSSTTAASKTRIRSRGLRHFAYRLARHRLKLGLACMILLIAAPLSFVAVNWRNHSVSGGNATIETSPASGASAQAGEQPATIFAGQADGETLIEATPLSLLEESRIGWLDNTPDIIAEDTGSESGLEVELNKLALASGKLDDIQPTAETAAPNGKPSQAMSALELELPAERELDVLSQLAEIATKSERDETESNLPGTPASKSGMHQPAFSIRTFPMLQVQRLPLASIPRVRQPSWKLKLAVGEGFRIEPPEPVEISASAGAAWFITNVQDVAADPGRAQSRVPQPRILVQVQQLGSRGQTLRWRVAVVPEEFPQAAFPMGQQYLDLLQNQLSLATSNLQASVERFKSMASTPGLSSAVRTGLAKQRKTYESQLELVSCLRQSVALANQMEGWLDGQIEVHAQFLDSASPHAPPLLQFGDFEQPLGLSGDSLDEDALPSAP